MVNCFGGARTCCGCFGPFAPGGGVRSSQAKEACRANELPLASVSNPAANQKAVHHPAAEAHQSGRLAITFSGGGFLLPYFIGVADALLQLGVLRLGGSPITPNPDCSAASTASPGSPISCPVSSGAGSPPNPGPSSTPKPDSTAHPATDGPTPLAGSSAGSLIAASLACGLTPARILESFMESVQDCRTNGSYRRLEEVLYRQLESSLPADAAECCTGVATVGVTQLFPRPRTRRISSFNSREDLIRALMASCHIPTYFNGELTTSYRGKVTVDGGVTALLPTPTTSHDFLLKVCCFPREHVARMPVFNRRRALHQLALGITPDAFGPWPYNFRYMLAAALHPRSYRFIRVLLEAGCKDAARWAAAVGIAGPEQQRRITLLPLPEVLLKHPEQQPVDVGPGAGAGGDARWAPESSPGSEQLHAAAAAALAAAAVTGAQGAGQQEQQQGGAAVPSVTSVDGAVLREAATAMATPTPTATTTGMTTATIAADVAGRETQQVAVTDALMDPH
ncbi:hypothetical protein VaNZ11_007394 [Volvox africanus]|uniref:Patatin n=1 Tax=Volvox africanus TaxID=51714 RepID=A0ABQ5S2S3_9CHLO|nr:hypothetical protein VaNZ11_007394 [Volvox africanus]